MWRSVSRKALRDQQWHAQDARNRQVLLEAPVRYGMTVVRPDLSAVKVNAEFKVARERVIDTLDDSLNPLARRLVDTDLGRSN